MTSSARSACARYATRRRRVSPGLPHRAARRRPDRPGHAPATPRVLPPCAWTSGPAPHPGCHRLDYGPCTAGTSRAAARREGSRGAVRVATGCVAARVMRRRRLARWHALSLQAQSEHHSSRRTSMAKVYWVTTYRNISNPDALAAYAKLATPAIRPAADASSRAACPRRCTRRASISAPSSSSSTAWPARSRPMTATGTRPRSRRSAMRRARHPYHRRRRVGAFGVILRHRTRRRRSSASRLRGWRRNRCRRFVPIILLIPADGRTTARARR